MASDQPLWLSRLALNPRSADVQRDLADCHALHRRVCRSLPDQVSREEACLLYRAEPHVSGADLILLVQSTHRLNWNHLPDAYLAASEFDLDNPSTRSLEAELARIQNGDRFRFRVRANPTRKIDTKTRPDGSPSNGNRVPLRGDAAMAEWLARKGHEHGFQINQVLVRPDPLGRESTGRLSADGKSRTLTFTAIWFDGVFEVADAALLRIALRHGVGPAKAFGFGLLSLAPTG